MSGQTYFITGFNVTEVYSIQQVHVYTEGYCGVNTNFRLVIQGQGNKNTGLVIKQVAHVKGERIKTKCVIVNINTRLEFIIQRLSTDLLVATLMLGETTEGTQIVTTPRT